MKLETFFEKFDQFADAPDAVDQLRRIILHLAVHGALVDQSDDDEPAKVTLQRVSGHKLSFLDSAELPQAWESVALGELLTLQKGKKPSSLNTDGVGLPYLDIAALERGELRQFTEDGKCPRAASGDLVIVCDGSRSGLVLDGADGVLGSTVSKIGYVGFVRDYLKLFLRSLYEDLNGAKKGAAIPHLNIPRLLAIAAPIPPLAEQKRIVAKVDELMALCDRLEAQQQERETRHAALARASLARFADAPAPANLHFLFHPSYAIPPADLRKSILTLAVQGKLVPQDPNDEPAEELLERAKAARAALVVERRVRQSDEVEYSLQEEPDDAPPGWVGVHVNDVAIVQGGKRLPNGAVFSESPTPHVYIRVTDMKNGTISETGLRYISPEVQREIARYIINKEDLYITIAGTIGDVGCVPKSLDGHNLTENAAKIVFRGFDSRFFQLALTSEFVQAQFLEKTKQMAQPKLALKRIAGAKFYLPPLDEQRRIVAKVEQLMAFVDALETHLTASRATGERLLNALVAELTGTPSSGCA